MIVFFCIQVNFHLDLWSIIRPTRAQVSQTLLWDQSKAYKDKCRNKGSWLSRDKDAEWQTNLDPCARMWPSRNLLLLHLYISLWTWADRCCHCSLNNCEKCCSTCDGVVDCGEKVVMRTLESCRLAFFFSQEEDPYQQLYYEIY